MKTAIVTGGASGIGLEFVKLLIKDDYKVFVIDNCKKNLKKLSSNFSSKNVESISLDYQKQNHQRKFILFLKKKILMY